MSGRREDKDGTERWWKSSVMASERSRISMLGPYNPIKILDIDIGRRIAISRRLQIVL
jgi:hypothetical protein